MSHTDRLKRSPATFRRRTGLTPIAFDRRLADLGPRWAAADAERNDRPGRRRKPGAGRKHARPLCDRRLMLLVYDRTYATHALLGFLFAIDDSAVGRNINPRPPLLAGIFRIPERKVDLGPEDIRALFSDATERPTQRPGRGPKRYYAGNKKRHTIRHQVVVVRRAKGPGQARQRVRMAAVSKAFPGSRHDQKVSDRARVVGPPGVPRAGDTGYVGTPREVPARRPPEGRRTAGQKAANRRLARRRIVAEHGIGRMKLWRIAADRYRGRRRGHTLMMKDVAGLHNRMFA